MPASTPSTTTERRIKNQIVKALRHAKSDLTGIVNSWGDAPTIGHASTNAKQ